MRSLQCRVTAIAIVLGACLAGCESYDVTVNERLVYTPTPLFRDYTIEDAALSDCVEQAILDGTSTIRSCSRVHNGQGGCIDERRSWVGSLD